jgi:hypothetical protein
MGAELGAYIAVMHATITHVALQMIKQPWRAYFSRIEFVPIS